MAISNRLPPERRFERIDRSGHIGYAARYGRRLLSAPCPSGESGVGVVTPTGSAGIGSSTSGGPTGIMVANHAGTTQFLASSTGLISAEGNTIQNVGTPILGTDAANKAYVDKGVNKAYEGTAIALAISQPVFLPGQSFAIRAGWGNYESQNAFGVSAAGIIARDVFGYGSTVALDGGVGVGGNPSGIAEPCRANSAAAWLLWPR